MYTMKADGVVFYDPSSNDMALQVLSPKAKFELNKADTLAFILLPGNVMYDRLQKLKTIITLEQDGEEIFRGRVLETTTDLYNQKEVYCESELGYLLDSVQRPYEFDGSAKEYFSMLIANHNADVEAHKQFTVGLMTALTDDDTVKVESDDYTGTMAEIRSLLLDEFKGYLRVRNTGLVRYLDYVDKFDQPCSQEINFGVNLVDIENTINAQDVCSVLVPVGRSSKGKITSIGEVNGGKDYIESAALIAKYGRVVKTYTFDDVEDPGELLELGQKHMEKMEAETTLTITAIDLRTAGANVDGIRLGDTVRLVSSPHGLNKEDVCTKIDLPLEKPEKAEYTFGLPRETLTDSNASASRKAHGDSCKIHEWIKATDTELTIAKQHVSEFGDTISNVLMEMDVINASILLKADQTIVTDLETRVSQAEISIDGANAAIALKADRTVISALETRMTNAEVLVDGLNAEIKLLATEHTISELTERLSMAEIEIDGLNAEIKLLATQHTIDELVDRVTLAEIRMDGAEAEIELKASKDEMATMERRLSQAEIDIDGANAQIALKASVADFEDLDSRVSQAEIDIDGANAAIALKASKDEVVGLTKRISQAEIDINGAEAAIALKASQSDVQGLTKRVSQAEIDIDGANQQIGLFAGEVDALGNRLYGAEIKINGAESSIELLAEEIRLAGYVTAEELNTAIAELEDIYSTDIMTNWINAGTGEFGTLVVSGSAAIPHLSVGSIEMDGSNVATEEWVGKQGYATSGTLSNYATRAWVIDRGYVTASDVSQTLDSYVMQGELDDYATQKWVTQQGYLKTVPSGYATTSWVNTQLSNLNSVYATRDWVTGTATKGLATQTWVTSQGYLKYIPSTYATQSWVIERNYATVTDVSQTLGSYVMKAELDDYATKTWVTSQGYLKSVPSGYATQTWVNNQGFAKTTALSAYATRDWVTGTATKGLATEAWVRENFSKASTTYKPTKIERYGSVSGTSIPVRALNASGALLLSGTVDAGDVYNSGKNAVTLSAAGWQGSNNVVSASNGKSVTVSLPTFSTSGGTSWSNNKTTVYFSTSSVNGYLASKTVDATSVYNSGYNSGYSSGSTAGKNAVTLSSAGWYGSSNVVSASNGKSVTVYLPSFSTSGGTSWSNNKTTVYFSTPSVSGALASKTVDATSVYNAGYSAGETAGYNEGYAAGYQAAKDAVKVTAGISWSNPAQYYARISYWGKATIDGEQVGYASSSESRNISGYC